MSGMIDDSWWNLPAIDMPADFSPLAAEPTSVTSQSKVPLAAEPPRR